MHSSLILSDLEQAKKGMQDGPSIQLNQYTAQSQYSMDKLNQTATCNNSKQQESMRYYKHNLTDIYRSVEIAMSKISDIYNVQQINQAIHFLSKGKERLMLIDKVLKRREEIKSVKALQAINNLAPLFHKVQMKVQDKRSKKLKKSVPKNKDATTQQQKAESSQQNDLQQSKLQPSLHHSSSKAYGNGSKNLNDKNTQISINAISFLSAPNKKNNLLNQKQSQLKFLHKERQLSPRISVLNEHVHLNSVDKPFVMINVPRSTSQRQIQASFLPNNNNQSIQKNDVPVIFTNNAQSQMLLPNANSPKNQTSTANPQQQQQMISQTQIVQLPKIQQQQTNNMIKKKILDVFDENESSIADSSPRDDSSQFNTPKNSKFGNPSTDKPVSTTRQINKASSMSNITNSGQTKIIKRAIINNKNPIIKISQQIPLTRLGFNQQANSYFSNQQDITWQEEEERIKKNLQYIKKEPILESKLYQYIYECETRRITQKYPANSDNSSERNINHPKSLQSKNKESINNQAQTYYYNNQ